MEIRYFMLRVSSNTASYTNIIYIRLKYSKVNRSSDFTTYKMSKFR